MHRTPKPSGGLSAGAAAPSVSGTVLSASARTWTNAMADEELRRDIKIGLEQARRGETKPWGDIRQRIR